MNWNRGLFRAWLVISVLWLSYSGWLWYSACGWGGGVLWCPVGGGRPFVAVEYTYPFEAWRMCKEVLTFPLLLLVGGFIALWIARGFRATGPAQ